MTTEEAMNRVTAEDRLRMFAHDPEIFEFDASDAVSLVAELDERDPFVSVETHAMLPLEPTDCMIEAAENEMDARRQFGGRIFAADIWAVMVSAYRDGLLS